MKLELESPYYKDQKKKHTFHVTVMRSLDDNSWSFAIDTFPLMDPQKIEEFWERMVEQHREKRRVLFAEWEKEAKANESDRKEVCIHVLYKQLYYTNTQNKTPQPLYSDDRQTRSNYQKIYTRSN